MNIAYDVYKPESLNPLFLGTVNNRQELEALLQSNSIEQALPCRNENGNFRLNADDPASIDEVDMVVFETTSGLSLVPNFAVGRGGFSAG